MQARLSLRGEMLTVFFSAWALAGAYLDGWAHGTVVQFETFFTPWHAVFYTGFLAMAAWVIWTVRTNRQAGERLSSPAHLALFIGGVLVIASPLRAAWRDPAMPAAPPLRAFLPALFSLTLATTAASFFFLHVWGFHAADVLGAAQLDRLLGPVSGLPETARTITALAQVRVFGGIIITTLLLMGPLLVLLLRWDPPFGCATILFTTTVLWMTALTEFRFSEAVPVALVTGLVADILIRVLRPSPARASAFRLVAAIVPVVLWSLYFVATEIRWDLAVSPELWVGGIFFTGVAGLGLSLAMVPAPRQQGR